MSVCFSVCVPVYNAEKYLEKCILSVLCQSYNDFQLILVDDGSTDSSSHICAKYALIDSRVSYIKKKNEGQLLARQKAFELADGKYVLCLDSDDVLNENALFILNNYFNLYNCDCVFYEYNKINDKGDVCVTKEILTEKQFFSCDKGEILKKVFCTSHYNPMWIKAFRKEHIPKGDFSKYRNIRIGEDLIHSLLILETVKSALFAVDVLYCYRINYSSVTQKPSITKYRDDNIVRVVVFDFLKRINIFSDREWTQFAQYQIDILIDWIIRVATLDSSYKSKIELLNEKFDLEVTKWVLARRTTCRFSRKICLYLFERKKWFFLLFWCLLIYKLSLVKFFIKRVK